MISRKLTFAVLLLVGIITIGQSQTSSFPPKPANKWQLGLNLGVPQILGDIKSEPFGGNHTPAFGVGLNIRKSLGYLLSMRLHGMYGTAYGQDFVQGSFAFNKTLNGAFSNSTNENYSTGADYTGNVWVPNYKTTIGHGSLDLMVNINNLNFHTASSKFLVYAFVGVGGFMFNTKMDALNGETPYDYAAILGAFGSQNTSEKERIDAIHAVLDGEYETQAEVAAPAARAEGEVRGTWIRNPSISGGFGFSYRIGTNMEIGLEHRASHYFDDLADGQRWELDGDYTDHFDMFQYTNLTFGINLGKSESVDPLWELNPLTYLYDKVASIDPENLLKDSDNDGVIDYLDKEPNTAEGVPVDTHGVSLDSDKDGCPDSEDPEPFSSPVLPMENCQNVHVTMNEVKAYVDKALEGVSRDGGGAADWILPYIFFDLNKYDIRPDAVPTLNQVAEIMNRYKKLEVNVVGHTDTQGSESMNMKLSENRSKSAIAYLTKKGVPESRMKIVYKGESEVIIEGAKNDEEHQMNRRVEFHIIKN
jgi:outer membrane protein OmpA-like peptidoglycan-associated protein